MRDEHASGEVDSLECLFAKYLHKELEIENLHFLVQENYLLNKHLVVFSH